MPQPEVYQKEILRNDLEVRFEDITTDFLERRSGELPT